MDVILTELVSAPDDVLIVRGTVDGEPVEASGWQSALVNHFDADTLDKDGQRRPDAAARVMTLAEAETYLRDLLLVAAPAAEGETHPPKALRELLASIPVAPLPEPQEPISVPASLQADANTAEAPAVAPTPALTAEDYFPPAVERRRRWTRLWLG